MSSGVGVVDGDAVVATAAARRMRILGVVAVAVVVIAAFQTHPGPGISGKYLAVSIAVVVFGIGTIAVIRVLSASSRVMASLLVGVVVAAAALVGLQPNGAGFLGVFPAVAAGALRLPTRLAVAVAILAGAALAVAWTIGAGHHPVLGIVLNEFGVAAFFLLAVFGRRYQEANGRAQALIAELNETRAAQAQAAALAERQRLAREMHDVLAHSLSGLLLNLEGARLLAQREGTDAQVLDAIGRAQRLAKSGLDEARGAIGMLRGDALPGPERLGELAAAFEADTGIACSFVSSLDGERDGDGDGDGDGERDLAELSRKLGAESRLTVYRVAQESLTNIRKHACPARVELRLAYRPRSVEFSVEDYRTSLADRGEGPGGESEATGATGFGDALAPAPVSTDLGGGHGLNGMRERAELLGGTLKAGPTATGFSVRLWIPA